MHYLITGGAGFIASTLVDSLRQAGHDVTVDDNFSTGREDFLASTKRSPRVKIVRGDLLDLPALSLTMKGVDFVFHFAANADVRFGTEHPRKDLEQNTIATYSV